MKEIELSQGKKCIVDDEDFEELSKLKWYYSAYGYAANGKSYKGKVIIIYMHREIMNCPKGKQVDHINGDKLDNRKENLRICSLKENSRNVGIIKTNNSGYKGVSFNKKQNKFRASICVDNKKIYLGSFASAKEAAIAYNKASKKYHGDFAFINLIEETE